MKNARWFKLDPKKWLSAVEDLSDEELRATVVITMRMYDAQGFLPLHDAYVIRWLRSNRRKWTRVKAALIARGVLVDEGGGLFSTPLFDHSNIASYRADMTPAVRLAVFERDGWVCVYCGTDTGPFECDHIFPLSRGGSGDMENLACSCKSCNRSKRDMTVEEWRAQQ